MRDCECTGTVLYRPCNSRVSWCAYLYVIYPSDSGVTSARTRAVGCFMVRIVHEATIIPGPKNLLFNIFLKTIKNF